MVRAARGFVEDVGAPAASKSGGLLDLARRSENNAERDCARLMVNQFELGLPIPKTKLDTGVPDDDLSVPVLRLRDWVDFLVRGNHTHILVGLKKPNWKREEAILSAFWANFERQFPTHPVFESARQGNLDLGKTFPMVFHGDEGRGRKRLPFLVLNFHSVLGRGLQVHSKKKPGWIKMAPNYHGHTLTSRFLLAALPKAAYTNEHGHVWESLMDLAADEARHMFFTGVTDLISGRGTFHMAMLHICGDWPWLADSGGFKRSYRNVQKHKTRTKPPVGICHMCAAGQIGYDFEQLNTDQPAWIATMFTQELFCEGFDPSPFVRIPHVPGQTGALWYFDVFHTMHLGVCKYLLGSCLALMSEVEPGSSIDARFDSLSCRFIRWCKESKRRPHIAKLTKELIGWQVQTTFPSGTWHKGGLSSVLMDFVEHAYEANKGSWPRMLQSAGQAVVNCNAFLRTLYASDAWLSVGQAEKAAQHGLDFLRCYAGLARIALREQRCLWVLQPKHHAMHHLVLYLWNCSRKGKTLNPLCMATQADEDFIGRPSRLSRRVTAQPQQICNRVLGRYLQSAYAQWVKAGYIIRPKHGTNKVR